MAVTFSLERVDSCSLHLSDSVPKDVVLLDELFYLRRSRPDAQALLEEVV